jgi:hypothetical protein
MSGWEAVLRGGRVIDPESGFDAVARAARSPGGIGIRTNLISAITSSLSLASMF